MTRSRSVKLMVLVALAAAFAGVVAYNGSGGDQRGAESSSSDVEPISASVVADATGGSAERPTSREVDEVSSEGAVESASHAFDREAEQSIRSSDGTPTGPAEDSPPESWQMRFMRKRNEATLDMLRNRTLPGTIHGEVMFASLKERDPLTCAVYAKLASGSKGDRRTLESGIVNGQYTFGVLAEGVYEVFVTETDLTPGMCYEGLVVSADSPPQAVTFSLGQCDVVVKITDSRGSPLTSETAEVRIERRSNDPAMWKTQTGVRSGEWRVQGLLPGEYVVRVSDGHQQAGGLQLVETSQGHLPMGVSLRPGVNHLQLRLQPVTE